LNPSAAFTTVPVHELIEGDTRVGMQIVQGIDPVAHSPSAPVTPVEVDLQMEKERWWAEKM